MKLTVHLVTWNGAKYIPYLFASLRAQTFRDWQLCILDNDSRDNTLDLMQRELKNFSIPHTISKNPFNTGFAGGHNKVYQETNSEYFLLLNQDMYLEPNCLANLVAFLDVRNEVAAVAPRLMKWNFPAVKEGLEKSFTNQIDALGLKIFRNRRAIEQFTQQVWADVEPAILRVAKNPSSLEVFGVSGAFPLYRRSAIQAVAFSDGTIFDASYHSYKEDLDLAYRLRSANFQSFVLFDTVAYHDRSGAGPKAIGDLAALKNKQTHSTWVKYHSYKNHLATLYKNEYWQNCLLDSFFIFWYESKKFVYFLLFDRAVLAGLKELWQGRSELKIKRVAIKNLRKISWRALRKWWQ